MMQEKTIKKEPSKKLSSPKVVEKIDYNDDDIFDAFFKAYGGKTAALEIDKSNFFKVLSAYLTQTVQKSTIAEKYNLLILFDDTTLVKSDSDQIYQAIKNFPESKKPLLLILTSSGGEPGSAYLIGKLCREFSNGKFVVVVPRHAKSAATLLSTAADEIHMGSLSELGPIDPQINGMPTLGLKNSIEHIAELVQKTSGAAEMFARYLASSIEPIQIGYYERVAESALQYSEKLLDSHKQQLKSTPQEISKRLVYGYKDHGFVID
jgi:ClpP class serine protease